LSKVYSRFLIQKLQATKIIILLVLISTVSSAFIQTPAPVIFSLELNLPSEKALDIIFVPEDYSLDEMDKFRTTVETYYQSLLSVEPFLKYRYLINCWRIETTEDFQSTRNPTMNRLLTVNAFKVTQFVSNMGNFDFDYTYPNDLVIVLVNNMTYGGSGDNDIVVSYTGTYGRNVMVHELGHSFGHLGDEYVLYDQDFPAGSYIPYPNIDWNGSKWQDIPGAGAYFGAWYRNLVRPANDSCIMRGVSNFGFCPVCTRALSMILQNFGAPTSTPKFTSSVAPTQQTQTNSSFPIEYIAIAAIAVIVVGAVLLLALRSDHRKTKQTTIPPIC